MIIQPHDEITFSILFPYVTIIGEYRCENLLRAVLMKCTDNSDVLGVMAKTRIDECIDIFISNTKKDDNTIVRICLECLIEFFNKNFNAFIDLKNMVSENDDIDYSFIRKDMHPDILAILSILTKLIRKYGITTESKYSILTEIGL